MSLKKLLFRLALIAALSIGVIVLHLGLIKNTEAIAERLFAPTYVPVEASEAYAMGRDAHMEQQRRLEKWMACKDTVGEEYSIYEFCGARPDPAIDATDAAFVSEGRGIHRAVFIHSEVEPHTEKVEDAVHWLSGILYAILGIGALICLFKWLAHNVLPPIVRRWKQVKEVATALPSLSALNANRKLRQAEKEFLTVKNLFDNGLITEEMYLQRKSELSAILGANALFRPDGA